MFVPLDAKTTTTSIASTGTVLLKPAAADTALIQNTAGSVLLVGYQEMPADATGFQIPANTAAELRILTASLYLKRKAGTTTEPAIISFGVSQ